MLFIVREIVGWAFVVIALVLVRTALAYVESRQVIEAAVVVFLCSLFMRSGIHLVRVSTAARISGLAGRSGGNSAS